MRDRQQGARSDREGEGPIAAGHCNAAEATTNSSMAVVTEAHCAVNGGGAMVIEQFRDCGQRVPPVESVTVTVKLKVPAVVGVPVIAPVAALSVKPRGQSTGVRQTYKKQFRRSRRKQNYTQRRHARSCRRRRRIVGGAIMIEQLEVAVSAVRRSNR